MVKFTVVDNDRSCLSRTEKFIAEVRIAEDIGCLGTSHLHLDPEVKPRVLPCRRIPLALRDDVKTELDGLVSRGVLIPVKEPT